MAKPSAVRDARMERDAHATRCLLKHEKRSIAPVISVSAIPRILLAIEIRMKKSILRAAGFPIAAKRRKLRLDTLAAETSCATNPKLPEVRANRGIPRASSRAGEASIADRSITTPTQAAGRLELHGQDRKANERIDRERRNAVKRRREAFPGGRTIKRLFANGAFLANRLRSLGRVLFHTRLRTSLKRSD